MPFKPKFLATGIGSMPFDNPEYAVDISLSRVPEAPFWPQLPKIDLNEQMEIQYSEGLPCIVIDREKHRMYFDTSGDYSEAFAEFYEGTGTWIGDLDFLMRGLAIVRPWRSVLIFHEEFMPLKNAFNPMGRNIHL